LGIVAAMRLTSGTSNPSNRLVQGLVQFRLVDLSPQVAKRITADGRFSRTRPPTQLLISF